MVSLGINNEWSKKDVKKIILFTITSRRMKYLSLNLTKELRHLFNENYKWLLWKKLKKTNKLKDSLCKLIERSNVKMSILLEARIQNEISIKFPMVCFVK